MLQSVLNLVQSTALLSDQQCLPSLLRMRSIRTTAIFKTRTRPPRLPVRPPGLFPLRRSDRPSAVSTLLILNCMRAEREYKN